MIKVKKGKHNKARIISINIGKHIPGDYSPELLDRAHIRCMSDCGVRKVHLNSRVHGVIVVHKVTKESYASIEEKVEKLLEPMR